MKGAKINVVTTVKREKQGRRKDNFGSLVTDVTPRRRSVRSLFPTMDWESSISGIIPTTQYSWNGFADDAVENVEGHDYVPLFNYKML